MGQSGTGHEKGRVHFSADIAFDSKGNVFVSRVGDNGHVQVLNERSEGSNASTSRTASAAATRIHAPQSWSSTERHVYVRCVQSSSGSFKTDGTFRAEIGEVGSD